MAQKPLATAAREEPGNEAMQYLSKSHKTWPQVVFNAKLTMHDSEEFRNDCEGVFGV